MNRDEFRAVWKRSLDLDLADHLGDAFHHGLGSENRRPQTHDFGDGVTVTNHFENFGRDQRDGFGVIQPETAGAALAGQLTRGKDQKFVNFPRREMHGDSDSCLTPRAK